MGLRAGKRPFSHSPQEGSMVKDPVCGMEVDEKKSLLKLDKDGVTHFFCSNSCMKRFKSDSQKFLKTPK